MNIYQSVEKFVTTIIADYKTEAKRVGIIASEHCILSAYDMNRLTVANARAHGAMQVEQAIAEVRGPRLDTDPETADKDALPRIIRRLQSDMNSAVLNAETHIAQVAVLNDALNHFRTVELPAEAFH